jgi:hypothetical protein
MSLVNQPPCSLAPASGDVPLRKQTKSVAPVQWHFDIAGHKLGAAQLTETRENIQDDRRCVCHESCIGSHGSKQCSHVRGINSACQVHRHCKVVKERREVTEPLSLRFYPATVAYQINEFFDKPG